MPTVTDKAIAFALACGIVALPELVRPYWGQWLALCAAVGERVLGQADGEKVSYVFGLELLQIVCMTSYNLLFFALYKLKLPLFDGYKVQSRVWPWEEKPEVAAVYKKQLWRAVQLTAFNNVMATVFAYFLYPISKARGFHGGVDTFPTWTTLAWQLPFFMMVEDAAFYFGHRALHHKSIYKHIHKVHHEFYYTTSLAATSTHPIEYLFANVVPVMLGPSLVHAHCFSYYVWIAIRLAETVSGHSGYDLPWLPWSVLPFAGNPTDHDAHHSINTGNYGTFFTYWDHLLGTHIPDDTAAKKNGKNLQEWTAPAAHNAAASGPGGDSSAVERTADVAAAAGDDSAKAKRRAVTTVKADRK